MQDSGSRRAFAIKVAAYFEPGKRFDPKSSAVDSAEMRLRRILSHGLFSDETQRAVAEALGVPSETLNRILGSKVSDLRSAVIAANRLLGEVGRTRFAVLRIALDLQNYRKRFLQAEGIIQVLSMARPRLLEQVFTPVHVEASAAFGLLGAATPKDSPNPTTAKVRTRPLKSSGVRLVDAVVLADAEPRLNLLGEPGSGKSTLLRRLGGLALQRLFGERPKEYSHAALPVLIELKSLDPATGDLATVVDRLMATAGFPVEFGRFLSANDSLLLLLDGLDEVPTARMDAVVHQLSSSMIRWGEGRFVCSCRTAAYANQLKGFCTATLADFDQQQIRTFIEKKWFANSSGDRAVGRHLWQRLSHRRSASLLELGRTPLLLTFLCIVFEAEKRLPSNRSLLYEGVLRVILREWGRNKGIVPKRQGPGLALESELTLLQRIAGPSFEENRAIFGRTELIQKVDRYLASQRRKASLDDHEAEAILVALREEKGILVGDDSQFAFSHTTLHEFLAARFFHQSGEDVRLAIEHLFDVRWREVFLLMAGLAPENSTQLLERMLINLRTWWSADPKAKTLLVWSARVSADSTSGATRVARQLGVMFMARLQSALRHGSAADVSLFSAAHYDMLIAREVIVLLSPQIASQLGIVEGLDWDISRFLQLDVDANLALVHEFGESGLLVRTVAESLKQEMQAVHMETYRPLDLARPPRGKTSFAFRTGAEAWMRGMGVPKDLWEWSTDEALKLTTGLHALELMVECCQMGRTSAARTDHLLSRALTPI